jgi:hypothetical protein
MNYQSDAPDSWPSRIRWTRRSQPVRRRCGRRPPRERPSLHDRSEKRWAVSRNPTSWFAAIAGARTWLLASSSGAIVDAASVSVNAMGRRRIPVAFALLHGLIISNKSPSHGSSRVLRSRPGKSFGSRPILKPGDTFRTVDTVTHPPPTTRVAPEVEPQLVVKG